MTANELRIHLNDTYGVEREWPHSIEVDAETYANCCQAVFNHVNENLFSGNIVSLGVENNGLMFKNVELIYRPKE
jgi:hypothetical protein